MGINSNRSSENGILPSNVLYFKEDLISEVLAIPPQKPDMERILNLLVSVDIESYKLVSTEKGVSHEGQRLTGEKLVVEVRLKEKLTYVADRAVQSVHAAHFETLKSMFVILPEEINGQLVCDLVRANRLSVAPYVEAVHASMLDCRTVHKCVLLFLDVKFC